HQRPPVPDHLGRLRRGHPPAPSPVPGRHRSRLRPEPAPRRPRLGLQAGQGVSAGAYVLYYQAWPDRIIPWLMVPPSGRPTKATVRLMVSERRLAQELGWRVTAPWGGWRKRQSSDHAADPSACRAALSAADSAFAAAGPPALFHRTVTVQPSPASKVKG